MVCLGGRIVITPEQFKQALVEFKEIYKEEFGTELSDQEATEQVTGLLQLFEALT
jgi:hypothetical protein